MATSNTPQLPPEILRLIFEFLGNIELYNGLVSSVFCSRDQPNKTLLQVCLVGKLWSSVSNALLYENCHIASPASLKLFVSKLANNTVPVNSIKSFAFYSHAWPTSRSSDKKNGEVARDLRHVLTMLTIAGRARLHLKILWEQMPVLIDDTGSFFGNLATLHVVRPRGPYIESFPWITPRLQSLTFEGLNIEVGPSTLWPVAPNLRSLRLLRCSFHILADEGVGQLVAPDTFRNLNVIELDAVNFRQADWLAACLLSCADTLEHLTMVNIYIFMDRHFDSLKDLSFLSHLRTLCTSVNTVGLYGPGLIYDRFPATLQELTLWNVSRPFYERSRPNDPQDVNEFIQLWQMRAPALTTIRVRGSRKKWTDVAESLAQTCMDAGISFQLSLRDNVEPEAVALACKFLGLHCHFANLT